MRDASYNLTNYSHRASNVVDTKTSTVSKLLTTLLNVNFAPTMLFMSTLFEWKNLINKKHLFSKDRLPRLAFASCQWEKSTFQSHNVQPLAKTNPSKAFSRKGVTGHSLTGTTDT